jgi:transposase
MAKTRFTRKKMGLGAPVNPDIVLHLSNVQNKTPTEIAAELRCHRKTVYNVLARARAAKAKKSIKKPLSAKQLEIRTREQALTKLIGETHTPVGRRSGLKRFPKSGKLNAELRKRNPELRPVSSRQLRRNIAAVGGVVRKGRKVPREWPEDQSNRYQFVCRMLEKEIPPIAFCDEFYIESDGKSASQIQFKTDPPAIFEGDSFAQKIGFFLCLSRSSIHVVRMPKTVVRLKKNKPEPRRKGAKGRPPSTHETVRFAMDQNTFVTSALNPALRQQLKRHRETLVLDNASYHTAKETRKFMKTKRIKHIFLPPRSPDLNPIENLIGHTKTFACGSLPANVDEAADIAERYLQQYKDTHRENLVECWEERLRRVRQLKGKFLVEQSRKRFHRKKARAATRGQKKVTKKS